MVTYITRDTLIDLGRADLTESLAKVAKAENRSPTNATFLSHSSLDNDAMPGVVRILEHHGASVYLDNEDPSLPGKSPKEIAERISRNISVAKKFVLFATSNTKKSKWVPWELGLADGYRNLPNVCIFPGPDKLSDSVWYEQEYLGVYDRIVWGRFSNQPNDQWLVWNHTNYQAVGLREWLERS